MTMFFELFRIAVYLWVSSEFIALMHLYHYGYESVKQSPIIHAMVNMFSFMALFFVYLAIWVVARYLKPETGLLLSYVLPFIALFVGFSLVSFRFQSTNKELDKK